ncbi:hypothetical protein L249_3759 [Ophiocordyceps polyrhachis-furcata BCC 54312]|uniref:Uncharacterized protein n=1 Tax=Ophiocordyceps polyrhachis-furcata BCC 54312 TaxID=1330021 RepID=A0A367L4S2_9HYPO|nr:hypothetical protein L249_3759 [Ophiocordyceps polyrhachis-furcata BCC 54312]
MEPRIKVDGYARLLYLCPPDLPFLADPMTFSVGGRGEEATQSKVRGLPDIPALSHPRLLALYLSAKLHQLIFIRTLFHDIPNALFLLALFLPLLSLDTDMIVSRQLPPQEKPPSAFSRTHLTEDTVMSNLRTIKAT